MPLYPRLIVWAAFATVLLVTLILSFVSLAGNTSPDRQRWTTFATIFAVLMAAQSGYLAAPFVLGKAGWPLWLTLTLMAPAFLAIVAAIATPVYYALTATRPDGASGWRTIASIGPASLIGLLIYAAPPIMLLLHRPR